MSTQHKKQNGKVAIVTGGSRGIGAAIVSRLAADGFSLVINYAGRASDAAAVVASIEAAGGQAVAVKANVAIAAEVTSLFDEAERRFGGVDVLVNNAGILQQSKVTDTDDASFDATIAVNLKGTFNGLREAARRMRAGGRIISLSTSLVGTKLETYGVYAATKAAVEMLTAILSKELRGRMITVNAVAPGPTATELFLAGKPPELVDRMAKAPPLERLGKPEDIAQVVAFLASEEGGWVNGQTLRANGGLV